MAQTSWTIYLYVQQKVEEAQREKDELVKNMALLQQEKEQLEAEKECLQKEYEKEKETCAHLRKENQVSWEWTEAIFEGRWECHHQGREEKMFAAVVKMLSVNQKALFLFCCIV